jgi:hypothetical protein
MELLLPETVVENLRQFITNSQSSIFDGVNSENVKLFLNEVCQG